MNQERRTKNQGRRTSVPFRVFRVFRGCPALNRERSRGEGLETGRAASLRDWESGSAARSKSQSLLALRFSASWLNKNACAASMSRANWQGDF